MCVRACACVCVHKSVNDYKQARICVCVIFCGGSDFCIFLPVNSNLVPSNDGPCLNIIVMFDVDMIEN